MVVLRCSAGWRRKAVCVAVLFALTAGRTTVAQKPSLAILPLTVEGLAEWQVGTLTDGIYDALEATEAWRVAPQAAIRTEAGTAACAEVECAAAMAGKLGVDAAVVGGCRPSSDGFSLRLMVVSASGTMLGEWSRECHGSLNAVVSGDIPLAANAIAGMMKKEPPPPSEPEPAAAPPLDPGVGDLHISSTVPGGTVAIDGEPVDGTTPLTLRDFPGGPHEITVRAGAALGSRTIVLKDGDMLKVEVQMAQGLGSLKVFTEPTEAVVHVDEKSAGAAPIKIDSIGAGRHVVRVSSPGYLACEYTADIVHDSTTVVNATLRRAAWIMVTVVPEDAAVLLQGRPLERRVGHWLTVKPGTYSVAAQKEGFDPCSSSTAIKPGDSTHVACTLSARTGVLRISSRPRGASLSLNGKTVGHTPYEDPLCEPGSYACTLSLETYQQTALSLTLATAELVDTTVELQLTAEALNAAASRRHNALRRFQNARRITFGSLTAVFGGLAIAYAAKVGAAVDTYNEYEGYDQSVHDANRADIRDTESTRNAMCIAAGACAAGLAISIPF